MSRVLTFRNIIEETDPLKTLCLTNPQQFLVLPWPPSVLALPDIPFTSPLAPLPKSWPIPLMITKTKPWPGSPVFSDNL